MSNLGYSPIAKSFLVKNVNGIDINITRRNNMVETIIGYKDSKITEVPHEIINQVINDINACI